MKPAIEVIGIENCAGCFACYNSCPYNAIEMVENEEGFYYPYINENCTYCGVCQKFCPVITPIRFSENVEPKFFAGWSLDEKVRIKSSSGGIFPELARYILENGGVVFGVAWNENLLPVHIKVPDVDELPRLMGSKYVQSNVGMAYKEALSELRKGKTVLFSGTPCQIAGLNTFLKYSKNRDKMITVGVVCHGVPSTLIFRKYLEWAEEKYQKKVVGIEFRNKQKGWENYQVALRLSNGTSIQEHYLLNPFYRGYLQNLYLRHSCYHCQFSTIPRYEDITLGDFWGVPKELRDKRGVSVIIANTPKGLRLLETLKELNRIELVEVDMKTATQHNPRITTGSLPIPEIRDQVLKDAKEISFGELMKQYFRPPNPATFRIRRMIGGIIRRILR